jgi:hypothetical protein
MSASVINAMMNLFFMLNAIILSNIFLISLMNEYTITCGALALQVVCFVPLKAEHHKFIN